MAIKKNLVLDATGAPAAYHVVSNVALDASSKYTSATVQSYVSESTFKSGKLPLQGGIQIFVSGIPAADEGAFAYIQRRLVEPKVDGNDPSAGAPMIPNAGNRYLLAGGEIVA